VHPPLPLSPSALAVLDSRYLARDSTGRVAESPEGLLRRVARAAAAPEARYGADPKKAEDSFFRLLSALEFLPNSPALRNAGTQGGQLAACFVLPVEGSVSGVFDALRWAALVQTSGGGTGFDFSALGPAGTPLAGGTHEPGPVAFLDLFHRATDVLRPLSMRHGANMGVLRVDHPDVETFIRAKDEAGRLTNFNLSVAFTDEFMAALAAGDRRFALRHPDGGPPARIVDPRALFDLFVASAWATGEPGALFIDRIDASNPTPRLGRIRATNPCSEQPLLPFEACVLGSLDVSKFLRPGGDGLDRPRLREAVATAVRFLDDLVDASRFPVPQIAEMTRANRKVGLGVMGFADLLIALGIPYDSPAAVETAEVLMSLVDGAALEASAELARVRGPFANFPGSRWERLGLPPMRNAALTTIAPTGTLAILAGCSAGIEPVYAYAVTRRVLEGRELREVHPAIGALLSRHGLAPGPLLRAVARTGRVRGTPGIPEAVARLLPTAFDVAPEWHVRIQAAFQRHVHSAVSKTINFPASATRGDIARAFLLAWDEGCKGLTVYRDGSRAAQVLTAGSPQDVEAPACECPR
jgi:ribonucleoside-diphosphate reductase alpha chain